VSRAVRSACARAITEPLESRLLLSEAEVVKDINAGPDSSVSLNPNTTVTLGDRIFFIAFDDTGGQPWVSDGTAAGTRRIKPTVDFSRNGGAYDFIAYNNQVYFAGHDGAESEIWRTDGTDAGTVKITDLGAAHGSPVFSRVVNGHLIFFTDPNDGSAASLWRLNPAGGQTKIASFGGLPITVAGNKLFISGTVAHTGVWVTDGLSALNLHDEDNPGTDGASLGNLAFFSNWDDVNFTEPWVSDGTPSGTRLLANINPGPNSSSPDEFTASGGKVYFVAQTGENSVDQIYVTTGNGATKVTNLAGTKSGGQLRDLTDVNGTLYFVYAPVGATRLLYKLEGGTTPVRVGTATGGPDGGTSPGFLTAVGSKLFFSGLDTSGSSRLYESDGTTITAVGGDHGTNPSGLINANGTLYYAATDAAKGNELHVVDASVAPPSFSVNLKIVGETDGTIDGVVEEGDSVTFRAIPSDPTVKVKYKWDFEGNGRFVDGGVKPPAYLYVDNLPDHSRRKVRVKAFIGGVPVAGRFVWVRVKDVAPEVKIDVPAVWTTWAPMTAIVRVKDKGKNDKLTYDVEWGDGTKTGPLPIANNKPLAVYKVFSSPSSGSVNHIVAHGYSESQADYKNRLTAVRTVTQAATTGFGAIKGLLIGGTSGNDKVKVQPRATPKGDDDSQLVEVFLNGQTQGVFTLATDDIIQLHGGDGNDRLEIDPGLPLTVHLYGGLGDDTLFGGAADDTLYGNQGRDKLYGGGGSNKVKQ
jgi:ELWxxDGT repeat protein